MAQTTSQLWKNLWNTKGTRQEFAFDINGVWYGPESEVEHSVDSGLFEKFSIGNAATAKLTLKLYADSVPRAATIKRFVRLRNKNQVSEWLPKGVFFTNRRSEEDGLWTVEAFDAMRKAEQRWEPQQNLVFPMNMHTASLALAQAIGTSLDSRSVLNPAFTIDYPADYTIRDELRFIAAAHGGNWIVTGRGELLLVPLQSLLETNHLVSEYGDAIVFGGVRILV
ncbi:MAG: hypothetical protein K2O18_02215 [Oscillospiraceae bacterium]|nr:hypothetical protein [Oscillospiraceae bacterium]